MKGNSTHIRIKFETKNKLEQIARELSIVQDKNIRLPEVLRRTANIPSLKNVLIEDALIKKRNEKR